MRLQCRQRPGSRLAATTMLELRAGAGSLCSLEGGQRRISACLLTSTGQRARLSSFHSKLGEQAISLSGRSGGWEAWGVVTARPSS